MEEVLERRFRRLSSAKKENDPWQLPDLVVIDGGPGQLSAAIKGMAKAGVGAAMQSSANIDDINVPICSLAKREEEVFVPGKSGPVNESPDSPALLLLRALRDESHRFALKSHRSRRSVLKSQ